METLPVQSAGAMAPTLSASTAGSDAPTGEGSFALTLGRALQSIASSAPDGPAIAPPTTPASPRTKEAAGDNSGSSLMAGVLLNSFVTSILQPAPLKDVNVNVAGPAANVSRPESTAGSTLNFASSLTLSAGETSTQTGTVSIPGALGGVPVPSTFAWTGKGVGWTGIAKGGASISTSSTTSGKGTEAIQSTSDGKNPGTAHSGARAPTTGQDQPESSGIPQPASPAPRSPGIEVASLPGLPVEQSTGAAQSAGNQALGSNPVSTPLPESRPSSQALPGLTDSWPSSTHFSLGQVEAAPQMPTSQGLRATSESKPVPEHGQGTQASPGSTNSWPLSLQFNPAQMQAAPQLTVRQGLQTTSQSNVSKDTAGQIKPALPLMTTNASASPSADGHSEWAVYSNVSGLSGEGSLKGPADPTLSPPEVGQAVPPFSSKVNGSSPSADGHSGWAAYSNVSGLSGEGDLQGATDPTLSLQEFGQAVPQFNSEVNGTSPHVPMTGSPEPFDLSSLLGEFAGTGISVKASGGESQQAPVTEKLTAKNTPVAAPSGGSSNVTTPESVAVPPATKPEGLVNIPARTPLHSTQASGAATSEGAWQKGNETEATSVPPPPSSPAGPALSTSAVASPQPAPPAAPLPKDAAPESSGVQGGGAVYASSSGSSGSASLTDSSTTGQGKSGQQNGTASGGASAGVATPTPSLVNSPATDPTVNLVAAHAPSVPLGPDATPAPPVPAPSPHAAAALSAWQNYDGGAGSIVRSATLSGSANGAEMHVEFRTGALGPLEVHAVLNAGSVGAEIHVQGQEAHTLLAAGLPSLERALGERNLRVENISVYQDHPGSGMSGGEKQNQQSGSHPSGQQPVMPWERLPHSSRAASGRNENEELANPGSGLSVRA